MKPVKESFKYLVPGLISYGIVYYGLILIKLEPALEVVQFIFSSLLLALVLFLGCQLVSNKVLQPPK